MFTTSTLAEAGLELEDPGLELALIQDSDVATDGFTVCHNASIKTVYYTETMHGFQKPFASK